MENKYHYQQSWAFIQKEMPHVKLEEYVNESSKLVILTWIANEKARSNELKKMELEIKIQSGEVPPELRTDYRKRLSSL